MLSSSNISYLSSTAESGVLWNSNIGPAHPPLTCISCTVLTITLCITFPRLRSLFRSGSRGLTDRLHDRDSCTRDSLRSN